MSEALQTNYSSKLPKKLADEIEQVAREKRLNKEQKEKLAREVEKIYGNSRVEPGEAVGIIAAQSISEPATQMSLEANEKILIKENNAIKPVKIGEFVDSLMEKFGSEKESQSEVLDLDEDQKYFIYSLDKNEKLQLKKIKSVIRHKSPKKLLRIKTASGRTIVATDHHSFVIRKDNKIVPVSGKLLKTNDRIPVMKYLPEHSIDKINLSLTIQSRILTKVEDKVFPYPAHSKGLPDELELNGNLGWFVGAYLSEGNATKTFVNISNIDENFNKKVRKFASGFNFTFNEYDNFRGFSKGHDIRVNSSLLSLFLKEVCGKNSHEKRVPFFAFSAREEFVASLLQAYFDGDGSVTFERKGIRASSESKELLDGIAVLLARFGIFCSKSDDGKSIWIPYKYAKTFLEKIGTTLGERKVLLKKLSKKHAAAEKTAEITDMIPGVGNLLFEISKKLQLPTRYVNNFTKRQRIGRETLKRLIEKFEKIAEEKNMEISTKLSVLKRAVNSDVVWDRIEKISYVDSESEYVYDISVDGLETFTTFDGVITHNTMRTYHFAGTAGIRVTYGLPRLIEIFDAKKEPETPLMIIYLKKQFNTSEHATKLAEEIIEKKVLNVVKKVSLNLNENSVELELQDKKRTDTVIKILKENFKEFSVRSKGEKISVAAKAEIDISSLQKLKEKILGVHVSGLKDISNAVVLKEGDDWIVNTIGSNLEKVLTIDEVDEKRTLTNDIHETEKILGIEAARNTIIREALKTMQEQALDIDVRHVMLVGDIMTFRGDVRPIGRYGVAGAKSSILARAAFEETIKHLVRASVRKEVDNFTGIFENVMIGQVVPAGTGMFDLIARFEKEEKEKEAEKK